MAVPRIRVELIADSGTMERTENLVSFFEDMAHGPNTKLKKSVAQEIRWGFAENFARESTGAGVEWQPLAGRTVAERQAQGFMGENPILVRTGSYLASWTEERAPGHRSGFAADPLGWDWEEGSADARVQDLEIGNAGANLEGRPVRFIPKNSELRIGALLDAYFAKQAPKR